MHGLRLVLIMTLDSGHSLKAFFGVWSSSGGGAGFESGWHPSTEISNLTPNTRSSCCRKLAGWRPSTISEGDS